ncbi:dynein heavy chain domain-containing protein 1 isoform X3 [Silurus meridionalis]|uniref:dynein heavy chain domain-containing protein 1 isoform X3 n=1 Tax=Silurus meridionalis TaxID=175797 RepID=UPI001EEC3F2B|nr:dynein heavy chain domain-containing protein 1 isoform X3 [Silurus meridionalis]
MSVHEKDVHRDTTKFTAPRGSSPDRQSTHNSGSVESPIVPLLASSSPTFLGDLPTEHPLNMPQISQLPDTSAVEVPQLVATLGPEMALADSVWMERPGLISSALTAEETQGVKTISPGEYISKEVFTEGSEIGKESKRKCSPLTGIEVFEMFTQKPHLGGLQFYHLKTSEDGLYRPYDLHVVPCIKAGSDHYIFSHTSVIHVKDGSSVGLLKLTEWYREAMLWKALRDIPFFRDYLLRKTFTRWHRNISQASFQRKCKQLQSALLIAVPEFRDALFHLTRQIEELKRVHWLPQDESKTYTLAEFQTALLTSNQQSQSSIEKFLHHCSQILTRVLESCHKTYMELQQEVEEFQLKQCSQPLNLQQTLNRNLHIKLNQIVKVLQKLGRFSALMDCMIVQNLVSITHSKLMSFHNKILKRKQENQGSLFQAELTFGEDGQLALCPTMHLFQEQLLNALQSVVNSTMQVIDDHSSSPDSQGSLALSFSFASDLQQSSPIPDITSCTSVPVKRAYQQHDSALKSTDSFPFEEESCIVSNTKMVVPKLSSLRLQCQRLQGQLYPLCIKQLEWHLHHHAGTQEFEKQQSRIIEKALQEIQNLCENHSWLVNVYSFSNQWSPASLESMRGWPPPKYMEHIQITQSWIKQVHNMPAAFTTSNKLITINCSPLQEMLELLLNTMEEGVLNLMSEELQFYATKLLNDLKKCIECFKLEPIDLKEFANYANMVKCYSETNMHQQLDNLCAFQKIHFENMTSKELTLIEETFGLWNQFVPLLRTAKERVMQQLPSMIDILDNTFSSLTKQLNGLVCSTNTGPYRDLNFENSSHIIPKMRIKSKQLDMIVSQLNELSETNQCLKGQPLDLSFVMAAKLNIEARTKLWEIIELSTTQIQEWKLILFSKFVVSEAQDKLNEWLQQANSIAKGLPSSDEMLQETLHVFEKFSQQLLLLDKLNSPTMKHKHWAHIFKEVDLLVAERQELTVGDLTSSGLWQHQNKISKICSESKAEADMEQAFRRLQQIWEGTEFKLTKFNVCQKKNPQCVAFYLLDLETLMAQAEDSVMTLSSMLFSRHVCDFKREVETFSQLLQELVELLDFCKRYQQKWIFLSRIFYDMSMNTENIDLIEKFSTVDQMFHELIQAISCDPHVLNLVRLKKTRETDCDLHGKKLRTVLLKGLALMEEICSQLLYLLDSPRREFPRLCILSDGEVMELLLLHLTLFSLLSTVRKCFRGVQWFEVDSNSKNDMANQLPEPDLPNTQTWINGVYGSLKEYVPFVCPLKFNANPVVCLESLEKCLQQTVKHLIFKSIAAQLENRPEQNKEVENNGLTLDHDVILITSAKDEDKSLNVIASSFLKLISEYPLQCLLVAEEVLWYNEICNVSSSKAQNKWKDIKAQNTAKLQSLCKAIQNLIADSCNGNLKKQRTVTALRAIILLIMKHSQQIAGLVDIKASLESTFEWQTLMKYRHNAIDKWSNVSQDNPHYSEDSVYVDILGTQLVYGNEYIGPENWMMVNTTSTERAHLGILLSLTSYKCASISGPLMCGKQKIVHQLGWALGQQVFTLKCCSDTNFPVICRMLLGALQSGAWLVLSSVDLLEQGILSFLGQCLTDIQQSLSIIMENGQQTEVQNHSDNVQRKMMTEIKCKGLFGEKNILAKLSYGCIIISSNSYSAEIPENLRITTRPVSLMHPDYGIISEIMLISLGFSEAACISRRLISLLSLAKDSCCLPEFVCRDQCSWLVLLRKVIDASAVYLYKLDKETYAERPIEAFENRLQDYLLPSHRITNKNTMANAIREEQALIKGVMSVLLSAISDHNRACQFSTIFEEIFPAARYCPDFQYIIEENERNALRNAVTEELQQTAFCADSQILHNALNLHQALKFSRAVVIVGPAGSGKTTLYRALAGALRRLAETFVQEHVADPSILLRSCWSLVDTIVLFPNALSHEELFGASYKQSGSWRDGAITKVLRDTERHDFTFHSLPQIKQKDGPRRVKYLVLDGEPLTCPKWIDFLSTFANPENPFFCLSSGEKIHISQEGLKILVETISLEDATPSSLAWCGLVYVSGNDMWKNVWKAEIDVLYRQHDLDKKTVKMWTCLAEDIFSCTIIFLKHKGLTSVISSEGHGASKSSPGITDGLQEIMSFIKILHALLGESKNEIDLKSACEQKREPTLKPPVTEPNARNLFLIAYIWGFGGQLHPRYWPQFDIFAREVLFKCRYKIEVPVPGTVFEHFFNLNEEMLEDATCSFMENSGPQHSCTPVSQYKKYAYLLERLLEAHYPALLVGEAGSGKTVLCKTLIRKRPHLRLPINPLLCSADLHNILEGIGSQNASPNSLDSIKQHEGLFLFVDDLHESAIGKTSATLETLRQCISKGGLWTSDGYHFKLFSSGAVSYLGSCRTLERQKSGYSQISPRLSRLFNILALPLMTADILYSFHSSHLQQWLKNFPPMSSMADMAHCIVDTTYDVYLAVCKHLSPAAYSPYVVFSVSDLQKVFQGMYLFDSRTTAQHLNQRWPSHSFQSFSSTSFSAFDPDFLGPVMNILSIARLWMHECLHTFGDRLSSDEERQKLISFTLQASEKHFGSKLVTESQIFGEMSSRGCLSESTTTNGINQQGQVTMQRDIVECIASRIESFTPPMDVVNSGLSDLPDSDYSVELSSSDSTAACEKPHTIFRPEQLLFEISSSSHDMVFGPEFTRRHVCRAQKFKQNTYEERDIDVLIQQLTNIVKNKEEKDTCWKSAKFAVYHQRVRQLMHILRVLLIPNGHGVLIGSAKKTGRKTTIRLAAYLTGYHLIEVHCGNEVRLNELLEEAQHQIDMNRKHVIVLLHESTSQATRDELLVIMETWHHGEDMSSHISALLKNSPNQSIHRFNKRKKQRHIHVFLLLPLSQHTDQRELEQSSVIARHVTKALTLCYCVEVYHPWSTKTLVKIASVHLKNSLDDNTLVTNISQAMAEIHRSATKYASAFLNTVSKNLFSPQTYIELIENFNHLFDHICEKGRTHSNRLETVLGRVNDLTDTAQDYSQEIFGIKVKIQEAHKELSHSQMAMDIECAVCEQTHQQCLLEESCLSELQEQLDLAEKQAEDTFNEVNPLYEAALMALLSLNQSDIEEVRHYRQPPDGVVILLNAICKLFNCSCDWKSVKHLFGQLDFLQELKFFDHSKINDELFEELGEIVHSPNFQTDLICGVSKACESLCNWVRAVYQYACVKRQMAPHEAHKIHVNNCMAEIRARLKVARMHKEAARERLEVAEKQHQAINNKLQDLSAELSKVEIQEKEVAFTIKQVRYYMEKWNIAKNESEMNDHTIPGDALLLAAAITYLGPFGPEIRLELLKKWHKMCLTGTIAVSPEDVRTSLFDETQLLSTETAHTVQIPVAVELHMSLSQALGWDSHHLEEVSPIDVLKLLLWGHRTPWAHKWTLLTDTQQHKECTFQTRQREYSDQFPVNAGRSEKENEFELIVSADDPEFIHKISHGATKGLKVLVTEIEHAVPSDEFLSILNRPAGTHIFDVFDPVTTPHPEFCLFLSTSLPAKVLLEEIHPFILIKVKVIDLSLSTSEVKDIVLSDLMKSNCSELWLRHSQLQKDKQVLQDKLHSEEVSLMDYILQSSTPLLQDPQFLPYVSLCQKASLRLEAGIEKLSNYMDDNKAIINAFHCIAALATALYQDIQDVGRLYPFYSFPLCNFLIALRKTLALKVWSDVICSGEMLEGVGTSDILHRIVCHVFAHYRPYLFPNHAELLWLYFSFAFFIHTEGCPEIERVIFLRGLNGIESTVYSASAEQSASILPNWIPTQTKVHLGLLEKLSSFHGLTSSLRNSSRQWQEYFHFPSATVAGTVPCQSNSQLTLLQRAILWKTFCPQWLAAVVDDFSACQLGQNIQSAMEGGPHISSPEALLSFLSTNNCPVIVTMPSPTEIRTGSIHPLHWIKHFGRHQEEMKGVRVVVHSFGSKCQKHDVLSSLNTAVQTGHWLVLNNCHLLDHWDARVITQLRQLIFCTGQGHWMNSEADTGIDLIGGDPGYKVHPHFRLWFITKGSAPLSIPAFIRMGAMHLVLDSQWNLKDELYFSLRQVTSTVPQTMNVEDPLLLCAILHSVLIQRQKLKHLGHGSIYKWSCEDLLALIDAHARITKQCHDPIGALEYVAVYLIYGGHVSDPADLEAVKAVCSVCLQPPLSTWGSGPHILTEIISTTGYFDEDILKAVQYCAETTLNNNDALLLGFSAEVTIDVIKFRSKTLRNLLLQSQDSFAAVRQYGMFNNLLAQTHYKMAQETLQALQTKFELAKKNRSVSEGKVSLSPIHTFLWTEWENLSEIVSSLLENAKKPLKDPSASPKITSSVISKLESRANLLQMYQLKEYSDSLPIYCLSAFANPRGFLAAVIRETVHNKHSDISNITLQFQVVGAAASPSSTPSNGIYLSGLELHGALWDKQLGALQDTLSPTPCPFPLLLVRTQETNYNLNDSSQSSPSNSYAMPLYKCPLYLESHSEDAAWSLSVDNIVTYVPLMTTLDPK